MPAPSPRCPTPASSETQPGNSWRQWLLLTVVGALVLTAVDAVLLQQKKAFFTGGFLAVHHTRTLMEAGVFVGASLLVDASVIAVLVALAMLVTSRLRLTPAARVTAILVLASAPLLVADIVKYGLLSYLGDAFDLGLMFDLTGRQPGEILAVSSAHLASWLPLTALAALSVLFLLWVLNRVPPGVAAIRTPAPRGLMLPCAALFAGGLAISGTLRTASEILDDGLGRKVTGGIIDSIVTRVTDVDADGYGVGGAMADPAPFDRRIFPYAVEIEGNGIDENGVGGDLPVGPPVPPRRPSLEWQRRPDVVLFVLESFRADALGRTVNGIAVTPVMDDLARKGIAVSAAFSHNGYTAQSRFHTFAGSLVSTGAGQSLIDDFKGQGYEVAYISGQDESFGGRSLGVGFERADFAYDARQDRARRYSTFTTPGSLAVPFSVVQERVAEFLARRRTDRPLFLYVNFHDTHYPYHHDGMRRLVSDVSLREEEIGPQRAAELRSMYDNGAANVDRAVGETLQLITRHLGHDPGVIVTADHGESLFEEGFLGHGYALNDAQTRIPFIVANLPLRIEEPFGQAELRQALGRSLSAAGGSAGPEVGTRLDKVVFQYLGNIDRPRQIAFATGSTRRIFDFRTHRYQEDGESWNPPEALRDGPSERFLELIRYWERAIRVGEPTAGRSDPE